MHPILGTGLAMPRMPTMGPALGRPLAIPTLPSASVVPIGIVLADTVRVDGTTAVLWWGPAPEGLVRVVEHTGAHAVTYDAGRMLIAGNASITVAAGDITIWQTKGPGIWKLLHWLPAAGRPLNTAVSDTLTKGFTVAPNNLGNIVSFTIDPTLGNYQYGTNNGAATWTAPTVDCGVDILVTNNATAGSITFSGFTVSGNVGDALTTTNTHKFLISVRRINSVSTYVIKALQ